MTRWWFVIIAILMEIGYASFYFCPEGPGEVLLFIAVNVAAYLCLAALVWRLRNTAGVPETGRSFVLLLIGWGVVFRLTLVPHPVVGSDDIYRYLWDGKVAASGVNPFAYLPTDSHLSHLTSADLPAKVNHPELRSVYPPLAQVLFLLAHSLFGESAAGLKLLLVLLDSLTMILLSEILRRRSSSIVPLVLYAWSPLPILYFGLDGHIDALGIPFLILALAWLGSSTPLRGAAALGAGALAKLYPLLFVPFLFGHSRGIKRILLPAVPVLMLVVGYALYVEPTWGVVDSLRTFGARWEFNGGFFSVVYFLTESNETAHRVSGIFILCCIGILSVLKRPLMEKVFWGFLFVILLSPVVHPWYLTWLAALLALRWSSAVFVFLGLSSVANIVVYQYRAYGQWSDQPLLLLLEYVPVVALLIREFMHNEVLRACDTAS